MASISATGRQLRGHGIVLWALGLFLLAVAPAFAQSMVSTPAELKRALKSAAPGDVIKLAGGNYGALKLSNVAFPREVTITSADRSKAASFSALSLRGITNLAFDGVVFDYDFGGEKRSSFSPFKVVNSRGIAFRNSVFDGDVARGQSADVNGYGYGIGLRVTDAQDVSVTASTFRNFYKGAIFKGVVHLLVANNEVHSIRSDGMNFVEVQDVTIAGNYFHDFNGSAGSGDHSDMIQFFKAGASAATADVRILKNVFDIGEGSWAQTIFMGDSGRRNPGLFYRDVLIEGNEIYAAHHHGISVGLGDGIVIRQNLVLPVNANESHPKNAEIDGGVTIPKIFVASGSRNVVITGNVAFRIGGFKDQSSWSVNRNTMLNKRTLARYQQPYERSGVQWSRVPIDAYR